MLNKRMAVITLIFAASLPFQAHASNFAFDFDGSGVSGSVQLTYDSNPNAGSPLGTSPNLVDPIGSYIITSITGTFSDTSLGISNTSITGIVPSNPANPDPTNLLAPKSFGFYPITNGVQSPGGTAPGLSYDNLFYPAGSPQTASDYPFHGGFLDIYGLVFTIAGGNAVNLWSNGDPGTGLTYGVGVTNGTDLLDYATPVSLTAAVPEPATWAMMIGGFGLIGAAMRKRTLPRIAFRVA